MLRLRTFAAALALGAGLFLTAPAAHAETNVLFIVDGSGSMKKMVGNEARMDVAKKVLGETLTNMPADAQLGLLLYGHRKAKDCSDMELAAPIGGEDAATINKMIQDIKPIGETPIADSLKKAAKSFKAFKGQQNSIILVTDGVEECKGDPCAAAKELKDAGLDVAVNIVGFTLGEEEGKALQCVTEITGGKYYAANDAKALTTALQDVQKKVQETVVVQTAKAPEFDGDILAAKNGGTLVYAPNDKWATINTEKFERPSYSGEGVWSFKDGKPATFDRIEILIEGADVYNLKDFEVLAGDAPAGPFRSLGQFTTLNSKVQPEGWQAFKFPETTAKYVKVVFKTAHSESYIKGHRMRLMGKIDESAAAAEKPPETDGIDILAAKNGGTLVYAPNDKWATMNTDKFERPSYDGEGVWSFKDGRPATFDRIQVLVPQTEDYTLKTFEVLAGDTPDGNFRSFGEFTVLNHKVMPDGWQTFTFPPATARFVKVIFKQGYGGYIGGHALRVIGKIDETAAAAEKPAEIDGTNLLAQSAGGMYLVGPNDEWQKLNDGKTDRATTYDGEGVWAFNGEKPAMIEAIEVFAPGREDYNLKEFEVLVGDEGPTGTFKSIGTFTMQNRKVMPDGWQRFVVPKVMAKYIKIKFVSGYGGYIAAYEFRVIGKLAE